MDRIVEIEKYSFDEAYETSLRPSNFGGYIGQESIKKNLNVSMAAAKKRNECLDHILLSDPAGLGKTTLANIISYEMGANIKTTVTPMIERSRDLAAILTNLSEGDILSIDEVHRLGPAIEEVLYPAMEDYRLNIIIGSDPAAQTIKIDLLRFTLIGATTRAGMLSNPLKDRFGMQFRLEFHKDEELVIILQKAALKLNKSCENETALEIAKRGRSTPRIALRFLERVRNLADVSDEETITEEKVKEALNSLGANELGFDAIDSRYLELLTEAKRKPMGLSSMAAALSEDENAIEDVIEPYLFANGYIKRTAKGRIASTKSFSVLKLNYEQTLSDEN